MTPFILPFLLSVAVADSTPVVSVQTVPPIKLSISDRELREGERAKVQVETRDDGHLLVLHLDTDGHLRVLFPIDPRDDDYVQGGRKYEIRGRADRESLVAGRAGDGLVYAAVSADPFQFDRYEVGGHWDYTRLTVNREAKDAEADLNELVQGMSSDRGFDYDLLTYQAYDRREYYTSGYYPRPYFPRPWYWNDGCDWWYRSRWGCNGWVGGYFDSYGYGSGLGYGGFGGYYGGYYPFYRNPYYVHNVNYRYPVVVGRPRGYTIIQRGGIGSNGNTFGGRNGGSFGGSSRPSVIDYRPRRGESGGPGAVGRPMGGDRGGSDSRPRARPSQRPLSDGIGSVVPDRRPVVDMSERARRSGGDGVPTVSPDRRPNIDASGGGSRARPSEPSRPVEERARRSGGDAPRYEPRSSPAPRSEPRASSPPARSEPRSSPPPRSNGGGGRPHDGGGGRPRGGGGGGGRRH